MYYITYVNIRCILNSIPHTDAADFLIQLLFPLLNFSSHILHTDLGRYYTSF